MNILYIYKLSWLKYIYFRFHAFNIPILVDLFDVSSFISVSEVVLSGVESGRECLERKQHI